MFMFRVMARSDKVVFLLVVSWVWVVLVISRIILACICCWREVVCSVMFVS